MFMVKHCDHVWLNIACFEDNEMRLFCERCRTYYPTPDQVKAKGFVVIRTEPRGGKWKDWVKKRWFGEQ